MKHIIIKFDVPLDNPNALNTRLFTKNVCCSFLKDLQSFLPVLYIYVHNLYIMPSYHAVSKTLKQSSPVSRSQQQTEKSGLLQLTGAHLYLQSIGTRHFLSVNSDLALLVSSLEHIDLDGFSSNTGETSLIFNFEWTV